MKLKSAKAFVQEVAIILIGCFLTAFAVDCILKPSGLAVTGVTGVAMVLEHLISRSSHTSFFEMGAASFPLAAPIPLSNAFLTSFLLPMPTCPAIDNHCAAQYNTSQRLSIGAKPQLIRRIFSLSQCATLVKGEPLYGRFGSYYSAFSWDS